MLMLKNKIEIMSRETAEQLILDGFPDNAAVISFFDPRSTRTQTDCEPVDYTNVCGRVFPVAIHDIDIDILSDYGLSFETYFPEADELARFIIKKISEGYDIICQCEYSQSRSAACAAAIKEYYERSGIEIFADYRYYPNQLIFNKLFDALKAEGSAAAERKRYLKNEGPLELPLNARHTLKPRVFHRRYCPCVTAH